jgi:hypothetical protein
MDNHVRKSLIEKMSELEYKIATWGLTNSQSNPGAVMDLRSMKKELKKIKEQLGLN